MKRILVLLVCFLLFAPITMQAQNTSEAIIETCPDLPSTKALAINATGGEDNDGATPSEIVNFKSQLEKLRHADIGRMPSISEADINKMKDDAEKQVKQVEKSTGKSLQELEKMNEAEAMALSEKMLEQQMATISAFDMSFADLQALESKSEKEIEAIMTAKIAQKTGLTTQELKAMEKMSDKEIETYMQQGDRIQRVQKATEGMQLMDIDEDKANEDARKFEIINQAQEEQMKYMKRMDEINKLLENERKEVTKQMKIIYQKHKNTIDAAWIDFTPCIDAKTSIVRTEAECNSYRKRYKNAQQTCYAECFELWRNQIGKEQECLKTMLPDAKKLDNLQAQSDEFMAELASRQDPMGGNIMRQSSMKGMTTFMLMGNYINVTESVLYLPDIENE